MDELLLLAVRTPGQLDNPLGPPWLEGAVVEITALGGFGVLALTTLLAMGYLIAHKHLGVAILVAAATLGATVISETVKAEVGRLRPDLVAHGVGVTGMSFPSGHAMLSAVVYLTLGALLSRAQANSLGRAYIAASAVLLTLLIGASRVYLGVHWPTDVLAGWCIGAAWALACWLVAAKFAIEFSGRGLHKSVR
ncbi:MAG: phosphatase PAP2 family protein [Hyphomonadaceae bacterium]